MGAISASSLNIYIWLFSLFFPFSPHIIDVYNRSWIFFTDIGLNYFSEFVFIILKDGEEAFGVYRVLVYTMYNVQCGVMEWHSSPHFYLKEKKEKKKVRNELQSKFLTRWLCVCASFCFRIFSLFYMITVYIKHSLNSRIKKQQQNNWTLFINQGYN